MLNKLANVNLTTLEQKWADCQQKQYPTCSLATEWIVEAFASSVHLTNRTPDRKAIRSLPLPHLEWGEITLDNLTPVLINPNPSAQTVPDRILSILLNSNIRRGRRELISEHEGSFRSLIQSAVDTCQPIRIVWPTLPFKCQNPITSQRLPDVVDLGEILMFAHLKSLCESVEAVYPPGCHVVLLTDGIIYADIFAGGMVEAATRHRERCRAIRDLLGLRSKVSVIDMAWVVQHWEGFDQAVANTRRILESAINSEPIRSSLPHLEQGMLFNIPLPGYDFNSSTELLSLPGKSLPRWLLEQTREAALRYASLLVTMKGSDLICRSFPGHIRATVHPKNAAQLALHPAGPGDTAFPHIGIPVVSKGRFERTRNFLRSSRLIKLSQALELSNLSAVFQTGGINPVFYLTE